ncbi:hypothetical protein LTR08_007716 [Meristemomyces frigidus]|nr:hypothetical protein LTR08_007716 [Meristemomyces frigidus]
MKSAARATRDHYAYDCKEYLREVELLRNEVKCLREEREGLRAENAGFQVERDAIQAPKAEALKVADRKLLAEAVEAATLRGIEKYMKELDAEPEPEKKGWFFSR